MVTFIASFSPRWLLKQEVPKIVRSLNKQLREKSVKTKVCVYSLVQSLLLFIRLLALHFMSLSFLGWCLLSFERTCGCPAWLPCRAHWIPYSWNWEGIMCKLSFTACICALSCKFSWICLFFSIKRCEWCAVQDKSSTSNLKIEALIFTRLVLASHSPPVFHPHIKVSHLVAFLPDTILADVIRTCTGANW